MYKIQVELEGVAPLLFNRVTPEELKNIDEGKSGGKRPLDTRIAEAHNKCYRLKDGSLFLPGENIKGCLIGGALALKSREGKSRVSQLIKATVFLEEDGSFGTTKYTIHEHWGRIPPRTGAVANIRRPMLATGWRLSFLLVVVDDARSPDVVRDALEHAGLYVGLGSWRPNFGRFRIKTWKVVTLK